MKWGPGEGAAGRVSELRLHPVKSAGGFRVDALRLDALGPAFDRRWMVVGPDGGFLSQRRFPAMARIRTALTPGGLVLGASGRPELTVPLHPGQGRRVEVEVWGDRLEAEVVSPEADGWVSRALGVAARLVRFDEENTVRATDPAWAPGGQVGFADGYPLLLLSGGAMDRLNAQLSTPVGVDRFRPNVVVDGVPPHDEDGWRRIRIGGLGFAVVKPCARCTIPAVDPETGTPGKEPLRTLAGYRKEDGKVWFGQNLVHQGMGTIRVGDLVEILERGSPRPGLEFASGIVEGAPSGAPGT